MGKGLAGFALGLVVVCAGLVGVVRCQEEQEGSEVVVLNLPELQRAYPHFINSHAENQQLVLGFDPNVMNENTEVSLSLRGAGYWNEAIECENTNSTFVTCPLPVFFLTGDAEFRAMFNASSAFPSPMLPLGHSIRVWDVHIHSMTPTLMCRSSPARNVTILAEGLFKHDTRDNVVVRSRGAMDFVLSKDNVNIVSSVKAIVTLPTNLVTGRYEFAISVDEGTTFIPTPSTVQVYEVHVDPPTLAAQPAAGPIQGGSSVVLRGVYGVLATEKLLVKLETQVFETNDQGVMVPKTHSVIASARTNDQIKPFLHLAKNPVIMFTAPATTVPGYYTISVCDQPAVGAFVPLPSLRFLYYSLEIHGVLPNASPISPAATSVQFLAPTIPRTGIFTARYGHSLTNAAGHTFEYLTEERCDVSSVVSHPRVLPGNQTTIEAITCPLPDLGVKPTKGTVLSLDVSANGQDYNTPSHAPSFLFYDAKVTGMSPTKGGNTAGHVVSISGRGFVDIQGMKVRLTASDTGDEYTVPAKFVGEGQVTFSPPKVPPRSSGSLSMDVVLLITPDHPLQLPSYTYDTAPPAVSQIVLDSGNALSESTTCLGSNVTLRVVAPSPIFSPSLTRLSVGDVVLSPLPRLTRVQGVSEAGGGVWVARFGVEEGMRGRVGFVVRAETQSGTEGEWDENSDVVDKTLMADTQRPTVTSLSIAGPNADPTEAHAGDTITILIKASQPLHSASLDAVTIGDYAETNFVALDPDSISVQAVAGFPSRAWKLQWTIPENVADILHVPDGEMEVGRVHLRASITTTLGNVHRGVTEKDGAESNARVVVKRRPGEGVDMSVFDRPGSSASNHVLLSAQPRS